MPLSKKFVVVESKEMEETFLNNSNLYIFVY